VHQIHHRRRGAPLCELIEHRAGDARPLAHAAERLRDRETEQARLAERRERFPRKRSFAVDVGGALCEYTRGDVARE
jgi:hypothetical protein